MRIAAFLFILFLAIPGSAQPPAIDSMLIDESKGVLSIYGKFGTVSGRVFCDSMQLPIMNWSDTLVHTFIPDSGKGSAGPVIIFTGAEQSNARIISLWSGLYSFTNDYPRHFDAANKLFFRIRTDLHSFLIHRTKQLIPVDVMSTSKLECDYRDLTPGSTIQDFRTLPLFSDGGRADSSFHCSASIDLTSRILKINVTQIFGTEPECAVDFKDDLPLDSVYQLVDFFHEKSGGPGSTFRELKADSTLFPLPVNALSVHIGNGVQMGFLVYPNPASKELSIRYTTTQNTPTKLLLYDMNGKLCSVMSVASGANELRYDVSALAAGSYILGLIASKEQRTQIVKIVK
jgi:hypothetical protein